ncbi:MAG: hypothetical protein B6I17_03395 [Tenericutes bacterium 4572_104]|nr:MAG: hypothetical protein B6I17_03395 [Tenericutes bacterium 4572_104]
MYLFFLIKQDNEKELLNQTIIYLILCKKIMANRQTIRTERNIFNALFRIMQLKNFNTIKVVEIVEEADVARLTFYRHFSSKEDIILKKIKEIIKCINDELNTRNNINLKESLHIVINVFEKYISFFTLLIKNNLEGLVVQSFKKDIYSIIKKVFLINNTNKYLEKFYEGAFVYVIIEWLSNDDESGKVFFEKAYRLFSSIDVNYS